MNFTLNIQYQPRNDLMWEIGYVGNLGRHQVIPVPFNQAQIATPASPIHAGEKRSRTAPRLSRITATATRCITPTIFTRFA